MKLRAKTHVSIAAVLSGLTILVFASARMILLDKFEALGTERMQENAERMQEAVATELTSLDEHVRDWSWWTDTYTFAENRNKQYVHDNLNAPSLNVLDASAIVYVDTDDQVFQSVGVDPTQQQLAPVPKDLLDHVHAGSPLLDLRDDRAGALGIITLPRYPVLVGARHILTGEQQGPSHGTLVMVRNVDDARHKKWEKLTRLPITLYRADDTAAPADVRAALAALSPRQPTTVRTLDEETTASYALLTDLYGKPALILKSALPRAIYHQAKTAMYSFLLALMGVGFIFWLLAALLLDQTVLLRLLRLDRGVAAIGSSGTPSRRLTVDGHDEISALTNSINGMLASLEASQQRMRLANEELVRLNKIKTDFTSIVSHELRTPLSTTQQAIEILMEGIDGKLSEKQAERLALVKRNVERLVRLTSNVLDFTKLESGRMGIVFEQTDLGELLSDIHQFMKPSADAAKLALLLEIPTEPRCILCDPDLVRQVLINLIDNAIKFTGEGGSVAIRLSLADGTARIDVVDTGCGIREQDLPRIFDPFYQLPGKGARAAQGSGLGLSISKQVIEMHGGRIEVHSEFGKGSTFSIFLPSVPPVANA